MTKYRNGEADAQMAKALRDGRGDEIITVRQTLETTIGMHNVPEQFRLLAVSMGLNAKVDTAGGWFAKSHVLTIEGPLKDVDVWQRAVRSAA